MNRPDIEVRINEACAAALKDLLASHAAPVFGAAKVVEHEVAAFRALQRLGYLPTKPD